MKNLASFTIQLNRMMTNAEIIFMEDEEHE